MIKHGNKRITILTIFVALSFVAALVPVIWVSKYAYPWADDFNYGVDPHLIFMRTGSVFAAIGAGIKVALQTYFEWQGTYTSCFLMAVHPGVFDVRMYHLGGVIMIAAMLIATYIIVASILKKILHASDAVTICVWLLTAFISIEGVDGYSEAFTWYNSAVHYTFGHAMLISFLGLTFSEMASDTGKKRILQRFFICILGFLAAGSNNITVFGGLLFSGLFIVLAFVYQRFKDKAYSRVIRIVPMFVVYVAGALTNLLAVGNGKRMVSFSAGHNSIVGTIRNAFVLGAVFVQRHFNGVVAGYIILIGVIMWWMIAKEEVLKNVEFTFPLPGVVTVMSYCILSALYAPFTYLDAGEISVPYINANLGVHRVANTIYFAYILFLLLNVFYYCGWLYKRGLKRYSPVVNTVVGCGALLLIFFSAFFMIKMSPVAFLTSAAVHNLRNGTAQYYGYQMAVNYQALESDEDVVYVSPMGVDPDCLYPHDAADWKEGARLFFEKEEVIYDHEPYTF